MGKYYYGAARVRALEARMVSPPQMERMADAPDFESAFNVLSETPYSETLPGLKHPFDFEELFEVEVAALKELVEKLAPDSAAMRKVINEDYPSLKDSPSPLIRRMADLKIKLEALRAGLRKGGKVKPGIEFNFLDLSLPIHLVEKMMDDYVTDNLKKAKYLNSGIEPLVGFYLAKLAEIKTLRFILICKLNYIEADQIKERLRTAY